MEDLEKYFPPIDEMEKFFKPFCGDDFSDGAVKKQKKTSYLNLPSGLAIPYIYQCGEKPKNKLSHKLLSTTVKPYVESYKKDGDQALTEEEQKEKNSSDEMEKWFKSFCEEGFSDDEAQTKENAEEDDNMWFFRMHENNQPEKIPCDPSPSVDVPGSQGSTKWLPGLELSVNLMEDILRIKPKFPENEISLDELRNFDLSMYGNETTDINKRSINEDTLSSLTESMEFDEEENNVDCLENNVDTFSESDINCHIGDENSELVEDLILSAKQFDYVLDHVSIGSCNLTNISLRVDSCGIILTLPEIKSTKEHVIPVSFSAPNVESISFKSMKVSTYALISIVASSLLCEQLIEILNICCTKSATETINNLEIKFKVNGIHYQFLQELRPIYGEKLTICQENTDFNKTSKETTADLLVPHAKTSTTIEVVDLESEFIKQELTDSSDIKIWTLRYHGMDVKETEISSLNFERCLNDTVIDFYLKYVYHEKIPEKYKSKVYIFNHFFYLGLERVFGINDNCNAEEQKSKMKYFAQTWTKNVDLISKDFIFIPIISYAHWYLIIICFASKSFEERPASDAVLLSATVDIKENCLPAGEIGPENSQDESKSSEKELLEDSSSEIKKSFLERERPCICFFDSLDSSNIMGRKTTVGNMLKGFLEEVWKLKNIEPCCPDLPFLKFHCPQQTNDTDCGLYLLQNAETFFEKPIPDFEDICPDLRSWFTEDCVTKKREEIKNIILSLLDTQEKNAADTTKKELMV